MSSRDSKQKLQLHVDKTARNGKNGIESFNGASKLNLLYNTKKKDKQREEQREKRE
jgi:hypothetical protein